MGRFLPPDHSKGDETTLGGYRAVHDRPAAFEGSDGVSYSVSIEADETGEAARPWGAYLLFVRWGRGDPRVTGHLETGFLAWGESEDAAKRVVGAMPLDEVKRVLDAVIRAAAQPPGRPWWEAMRDDA